MNKALLLAVSLFPALALAQSVPAVMSYQGRLLNSDGSVVTGAPTITFSIYAVGEGGTALWTETRAVQLTNGFYAVHLGSQTAFPANLFDGSARWLGVRVGDDAEMTPRQYIATVPYAFRALNATNAANATNVVAGGNATTGNLSVSGTITVTGTAVRIPGLVVGGFTTTANCGSSGCTYSCGGTWGDGLCTGSSGSCNGGTRPVAYRGTPRLVGLAGTNGTGAHICVQ
ncbi:MAG TPA: hypothetical protein VEB43_11665 [Anaeromyxobacter sp.]|nr:hypothetical protein [Anaeromyxobacter sp.]